MVFVLLDLFLCETSDDHCAKGHMLSIDWMISSVIQVSTKRVCVLDYWCVELVSHYLGVRLSF